MTETQTERSRDRDSEQQPSIEVQSFLDSMRELIEYCDGNDVTEKEIAMLACALDSVSAGAIAAAGASISATAPAAPTERDLATAASFASLRRVSEVRSQSLAGFVLVWLGRETAAKAIMRAQSALGREHDEGGGDVVSSI